ncbi:type II toxin-antitoxin system HigB family toxin [Fibrella aquatica]|uniref:type II toxin-antitoxin system HigB family toxin n=1 Tax=Fibrella aquatica TaxID=3242487 RepID=UPI00351F98BF
MVIISKTVLKEFGKNHPDASSALNDWYHTVRSSEWRTFADIKRTFNSVDYVSNNRYVFNLKGNQYRLVALVFFSVRTVYIKFIGTHAAYDRIDVTTIDLK